MHLFQGKQKSEKTFHLLVWMLFLDIAMELYLQVQWLKKATPYVSRDHGLYSTCGGNSIMVSK
jgi:hypothetical protein